MAIKKVAIILQINTGEKEESSGTSRVDHPAIDAVGRLSIPGADETYFVFVNDSDHPGPLGKPNKKAMLDAAAHELGHVLSSAFRLSGGMHEDPRQRNEINHVPFLRLRDVATEEQAKRIWRNELLAWKIAKKIRPNLNISQARKSLGTYLWAKDKSSGGEL